MIVPEVAGGAAAELDDLRAACAGAVTALGRSGARQIVVFGADSAMTSYDPPQRGSLRPWGVDLDVSLGPHDPLESRELPLSLAIGAWLLRQHPPHQPVVINMQGIASSASAAECRDFGECCAPDGPWALLVMGDGSASRGVKSPGYDDARAEPYDNALASALATVDLDVLHGLDPVVSTELGVAGRPAFQAAAGAVAAAGGTWRGDLSYHAAPYGVGYFVASWVPA
ncbi:hypothetical protein [Asanoa siamensis]|uniref:Catalytic LigB subunit of aromatic ring-opening dioxygenase n=1 Tax=Asanoa siamensis TaxID=926357 RepID=A0ABQ4CX13_9ACTN|nr:hypothetical protein [Asanoa siamensis]GIF75814.1 hypothetical protein Asi02nite_53320 [Asanoa siamensis]